MRAILFGCVCGAALAGACASPGQQRLTRTSVAQVRPVSVAAPAASTSDREREQLVQSFDDMAATKRAHREAHEHATPHAPLQDAEPPPFPLPPASLPPPPGLR